ncbi:uncharacterized protein IUM83_08597 [Phytophthora cinnamomi]|uniref:uncharacterized protein n=1 Tax=Phytophthora cinnamomi TaxID=4785 RepID=UPI00355A96B5|nr:hypothetical protein IUM83_08597 [Phytophthora cinnamomi]
MALSPGMVMTLDVAFRPAKLHEYDDFVGFHPDAKSRRCDELTRQVNMLQVSLRRLVRDGPELDRADDYDADTEDDGNQRTPEIVAPWTSRNLSQILILINSANHWTVKKESYLSDERFDF